MKTHSSRHSHKHHATPRRNPEEGDTVKCENCRNYVKEGTLQVVDLSQMWCEECVDSDAYTCEHEDRLRSTTVEVIVSTGRISNIENWCEDCADNDAALCESSYGCGDYMCGNYMTVDLSEEVDGVSWCPDCVQNHSTYCERDRHRADSENVGPVYVGNNEHEQAWCEDCRDNAAYFCEVCDNYYDREHDHEDEDAPTPPPTRRAPYPGSTTSRSIGYRGDDGPIIRTYHVAQRHIPFRPIDSEWVRKQPKPLYFGVELEVKVPRNDSNLDKHAFKVVDSIGPRYGDFLLYDIQHDGSLHGEGFEIITQPAGLDTHLERWQVADLKGLRGHDVKGCGLHVHFTKAAMKKVVDRNGETKYPAVGRMGKFIYAEENKHFLETVARRTFEEVAIHVHRVSGYRVPMGSKPRTNRYEALNLTNTHTFEFRLPRSTTKLTTLQATLEFTYMLIRFCEERSNDEMDVEHFKKFIVDPRWASDTRFLRAYLVDRGLATAQEMKLPRQRSEAVRTNPSRRPRLDDDTPGYYARTALAEYRRTGW